MTEDKTGAGGEYRKEAAAVVKLLSQRKAAIPIEGGETTRA